MSGNSPTVFNATWVLAIGLALLAMGSLVMLVPLLAMVFLGGFVRGLGWAGVNTGGYTVLATTAPAERRGEAAGYYTGATSGASIIFPVLGLWLIDRGAGAAAVFIVSALGPVLGIALALGVSRSAGAAARKTSTSPSEGSAVFDRGVLVATGLNLCSTLAMPSVMAFLPLYARSLDIANIGVFYAFAGITNIFVRPLLGR